MLGVKLITFEEWKEFQELKKQQALLHSLACAARSINGWIRRNVDAGFLDRMTASQHEISQVHEMRKLLAEYFKVPIEQFEPSVYVLKQSIEGKTL